MECGGNWMYCEHCGQKLLENEEHCTNCGADVTKDSLPHGRKGKNTYVQRMRTDGWFLVYVIVSALAFICFVYTFFSIGMEIHSSYGFEGPANQEFIMIVTLFGFIGLFIVSFFLSFKTNMMKWWIVFMLFYVNIFFLVVVV